MRFRRLSTCDVIEFTGLSKNHLDQLEKTDRVITIPRRGHKIRYYPFELILWLKLYKSLRDKIFHRKALWILPNYDLISERLGTAKFMISLGDNSSDSRKIQFLDLPYHDALLQNLIEDNARNSEILDTTIIGENKFVMVLLLEKYRESVDRDLTLFIESLGNGAKVG